MPRKKKTDPPPETPIASPTQMVLRELHAEMLDVTVRTMELFVRFAAILRAERGIPVEPERLEEQNLTGPVQ